MPFRCTLLALPFDLHSFCCLFACVLAAYSPATQLTSAVLDVAVTVNVYVLSVCLLPSLGPLLKASWLHIGQSRRACVLRLCAPGPTCYQGRSAYEEHNRAHQEPRANRVHSHAKSPFT